MTLRAPVIISLNFASQGLYAHRSQEAKIDYFYIAALGRKWASTALANFYTQEEPWSFTQLSQTLHSACLQ